MKAAALFAVAATLSAPLASAADEIIEDTQAPPIPSAPPASDRVLHASVYARAGMQLSWDDLPGGPRDVAEWRTRVDLGAGRRENDRFSWEVGVRLEAYAHAPKSFDDAAYSFDARPWESYVDVAVGDRVRIKAGEQIVAWGRLDIGSAADVLGAYDLRLGPTLDPDALRIPTPTVTATWVPSDAFQLDVGYTPFFTPHRFDVTGTNWALVGPNAPPAVAQTFAKLKSQLDPSSYVRLTNDLATVNAPTPRPDNGEAAARATWRAGPFDLAATYGYVRSKVPALTFNPAVVNFLQAPSLTSTSQVNLAVQDGQHLVDAHYDRYHQVALDLEGAAGPVTIAGEVGFSPERTLFVKAADTGLPGPASSGVAQTGARVAYAEEDHLVLLAEASVFVATDAPPPGLTYYALGPHRRLFVAFAAAHDRVGDHVFDLAAIATSSGPSLMVIPQYGYKPSEPLTLGVGAAIFGGPRGDDASIAAVQRGLDEVFLFADWRP